MNGENIKQVLLKKGYKIGQIADLLSMTRQNLGYHFRKNEADYEFLLKIKDKLKIDFTSGSDAENIDSVEKEKEADPETKAKQQEIPQIANDDLAAGLYLKFRRIDQAFDDIAAINEKIDVHEARFTSVFQSIAELRLDDGQLDGRLRTLEDDVRTLKKRLLMNQ